VPVLAPVPQRKRPANLTLALKAGPASQDPLDGLLAGWPTLEKKDLRQAQHEARLGR
jgi:hypothetical protein